MVFKRSRPKVGAAKRQQLVAHAQALRLRVDCEPVAMTTLDAVSAPYGLSASDAANLELALRRTLPLATLDEALDKAKGGAGVARAER